jgi:hypothetical protein
MMITPLSRALQMYLDRISEDETNEVSSRSAFSSA